MLVSVVMMLSRVGSSKKLVPGSRCRLQRITMGLHFGSWLQYYLQVKALSTSSRQSSCLRSSAQSTMGKFFLKSKRSSSRTFWSEFSLWSKNISIIFSKMLRIKAHGIAKLSLSFGAFELEPSEVNKLRISFLAPLTP